MATLNFSSAIPELLEWTDASHFGKKFFLDTNSGDHATFTTGANDGMSIKISGAGLTYNNAGDLISGTVQSITYDYGGGAYLTVKNLSMSAPTAQGAFEFAGIWALLPATAGADIVNGSSDHDNIFGWDGRDRLDAKGGNDVLEGGDGNDRMTGGKGADTFIFKSGDHGRDIITDFDPKGGEGQQDFIDIGGKDYALESHGKNTIITFDAGDEIVLLGIKPGQITDSDFVW